MTSLLDPENRLSYSGDLRTFVDGMCVFFGLGTALKVSHLAEGYEDCNLKLQTTSGTYVCKIFADNQLGDYSKSRRGEDVADRLVEILLAVRAHGANTIELVSSKDQYLY